MPVGLGLYFLVALAFFALIQIVYVVYYWSGMAFYNEGEKRRDFRVKPVSVVIAARNEEENLKTLIPLLMQQDHQQYEVIVVNDCSCDDTDLILRDFKEIYSNLKTVKIEEQDKWPTGKKFALTLGIKAASYDLLLFMDADCEPASLSWISNMQARFSSKAEVVLGVGLYKKEKGFLNYMIRYDTLLTALNYLGFAVRNSAYMGVGRNLAYRKQLFFYHKGFSNHIMHPSGDDDLFINQAASNENTNICLEPQSFTISNPSTTWGQWFRQKKRHYSTFKFYKSKHKFLLGLNSISFIFFLMLVLPSFWFQKPLEDLWFVVLGITTITLLVRWIMLIKAMVRLDKSDMIWLLPVLEIMFLIVQPIQTVKGYFSKNYYWR